MNRAERLALAVRCQVAGIRNEETRRWSSLIGRREMTARKAAEAQEMLDDAMGEHMGTIWEWVGMTETELRGAVHGALNDYG
jgi:hypothetical protein